MTEATLEAEGQQQSEVGVDQSEGGMENAGPRRNGRDRLRRRGNSSGVENSGENQNSPIIQMQQETNQAIDGLDGVEETDKQALKGFFARLFGRGENMVKVAGSLETGDFDPKMVQDVLKGRADELTEDAIEAVEWLLSQQPGEGELTQNAMKVLAELEKRKNQGEESGVEGGQVQTESEASSDEQVENMTEEQRMEKAKEMVKNLLESLVPEEVREKMGEIMNSITEFLQNIDWKKMGKWLAIAAVVVLVAVVVLPPLIKAAGFGYGAMAAMGDGRR